MGDIQVVFLAQKGEIRQGKLKSLTPASLMSALKKKVEPTLLGKSYWRQKQRTLFFYGYDDGKEENENQHHLPSPLEGMTFYGDILVIASTSVDGSPPTNLKTAEYETFYTSNLEGEDSEAESEEGSDLVDNVNGDEGIEEDDEGIDGVPHPIAASHCRYGRALAGSECPMIPRIRFGGFARRGASSVRDPLLQQRNLSLAEGLALVFGRHALVGVGARRP